VGEILSRKSEKSKRAAAWAEPANVRKLADWFDATMTEGDLLTYYAARLGLLAGLAPGHGRIDAIRGYLEAEHGLTFFQARGVQAARVLAILKADAEKAAAAGGGETPGDLITTAVALRDYLVSRTTLRRLVAEGKIHDYRKPGHKKNAALILSRAEVASKYPSNKK
jgi:hypothetical protein